MKISEIRQLTTEELVRRLEDEQNNLVDLRFTHALKQLTNTAKLGDTKRTIARLMTELKLRNSKEAKSNG
ncbi:MAG: 50S ribosomal protein L29 [Ignavibacteriales bacterium]|nr:50S ribosomal protein L29 [Ignavibacteriaceae bacterium]MCK6615483.1 50S ribosomal protein L29 [Ignavibacteriaceae bacterium]QOJ29902.1 MAG: 50S ribosomal protein L29 [Ignavibacteriales bacterium]